MIEHNACTCCLSLNDVTLARKWQISIFLFVLHPYHIHRLSNFISITDITTQTKAKYNYKIFIYKKKHFREQLVILTLIHPHIEKLTYEMCITHCIFLMADNFSRGLNDFLVFINGYLATSEKT